MILSQGINFRYLQSVHLQFINFIEYKKVLFLYKQFSVRGEVLRFKRVKK